MTVTPRDLPQVQAVLRADPMQRLIAEYSHGETVDALRAELSELRQRVRSSELDSLPDFTAPEFAETLVRRIQAARAPSPRQVINATGILIHTNLGRARLAPLALDAMRRVGRNSSDLELDLKTGKRGSRHDHVSDLVGRLTGAEAALVVNNCAAAVLLALMATASGRSVVASRGELIEIGGAFRLPDVIEQSGARLREVGTTNRTRTADYAAAIDTDTAVLLKSHTSNFRVVGFTAAPERAELAQLSRGHDLILMEDLGSGVLIDLSRYGLPEEPVVADILKQGVDLVMFSGDKLLGGPQAGILAGRADVIERMRTHPLMRAVRIDKLSLAALEATLRLYLPPNDPVKEIPVLRMLATSLAELRERADLLARDLPGVTICDSRAQVGGGALPGQDLDSVALCLNSAGVSARELSDRLRTGPVPVIGRITQDRVWIDMRSLLDEDVPDLHAALHLALT